LLNPRKFRSGDLLKRIDPQEGEHALELVPRIALAAGARCAAQVLSRSEQFHCTECGTPFISRAVLERSMQHVKDHPLFAEGGTDLLKLCMTCRQKRMLVT
jgi:hypothetical protein